MNETPLQSYLRLITKEHDAETALKLLTERYGINVYKHPTLPLVGFKYNQIESPKYDSVVRWSRGTVLEYQTWNLVAQGMQRFYNYGESPIEAEKFNWNNFEATAKEDGCFLYDTKICLWGGGTIKIGDIVTKNLRPTLIGLDEKGNTVPSKVTNVFNNGTKNNWYYIKIKNNGYFSTDEVITLKVTGNHSININGKFIPTKNIKPNDKCLVVEKQPDDWTLKIINAGLLGDGSLCNNGTNFRYSEGHIIKHEQYVDTLINWFGECVIKKDYQTSGFGSKMVRVCCKTYNLKDLHEKWYKDGKKVIPEDLSWIDDFCIAKWFMDDGYTKKSKIQKEQAGFSTAGFIESDIQRLANILKEKYRVDAKLAKYKNKYIDIRINTGKNGEIDTFWKAISPYIVPCMRYKLPEKYRKLLYKEINIQGKELLKTREAVVLSIEPISITKINKSSFPSGRVGFDIETETNNYFAKGILVHNSLTLLYHYDNEWHVNTSGSFGFGEINDSRITWKNLFWDVFHSQGMDIAALNPEVTYIFELCSRYNKVVRDYSIPKLYLITTFLGTIECGPLDFGKTINATPVSYYDFSSYEELKTFLEHKQMVEPTFEGFVVKDNNGIRFKIKSETYVNLHHLHDNGNIYSLKRLVPIVLKAEQDEVAAVFPELKDKFQAIKGGLESLYGNLRDLWAFTKDIESQKDFAMAIAAHPMKGLLFTVRKVHGKNQTETHLKNLWVDSAELILKCYEKILDK